MVKMNKFFSGLILLCLLSSQAQGRIVSQINIKGIGLQYDGRDDKNEEKACKIFRTTKKQLIHFFNSAKESKESGELLHDYYSPCVSSGSIKFKDGSSGDWTVQSSGLAYVIFSNGESATFFYNHNKWKDPFACTYGLGDEPKC